MTRHVSLLAVLALTVAACTANSTGEGTDPPHGPTTSISENAQSGTESTEVTTGNGATVPQHLEPMAAAWNTDFSKTTIDLNELLVGIPVSDPRDRIPPIDSPQFEPVSQSDWLEGQEPGVLVEIGSDARFYPLSIMTRHEIVNDKVGGVPVAVTYCPLCNTAVTFDRRFEGKTLRLGVSGLLRNSDLVMWDNETHTLWQQVTGEAIVGEQAGKSLTLLGSAIVRWADFEKGHPDGQALRSDQGFGRNYGFNPYEFYSSRERPYNFYRGEIDDRFPALERVVGLTLGGLEKAYPFSLIREARVVHDRVGDQPVVVFWGASDTADALDSGVIAEGAGIGTAVAYSPIVDDQELTFEPAGDTEFVDNPTGTTWTILGKAIDGELEGEQLELLAHRNEFWFAWQAFFPDADVWTG